MSGVIKRSASQAVEVSPSRGSQPNSQQAHPCVDNKVRRVAYAAFIGTNVVRGWLGFL
jgi:hypothetical protein